MVGAEGIEQPAATERAEGHADGLSWVWELKSVNSKQLDLRFRLPPGFDALEIPLRTGLAQRLKRGAVSVTLSMSKAAAGAGLRVNRVALAEIVKAVRELEGEIEAAPPRLDGLLALRGVLESTEEVEDDAIRERRQVALLAGWEKALDDLAAMRLAEGERLQPVLEARLAEISDLVASAESSAAAQPAALKARLTELVGELLDAAPALPEERLAQEAALLVAKADVREELDRLTAHVQDARGLIAGGAKGSGGVGRKLDFLAQEFNREANTLCSKSADIALTRVGLALKAVIDQFREQAQNVE